MPTPRHIPFRTKFTTSPVRRLLLGGILSLSLAGCNAPPPAEAPKIEASKAAAPEKPVDARFQEQPTPNFSADQILNGEAPGRKASPAVAEVNNDEGFAKDRLYHVPAPGVHPRILFGPEDLPRIRRQLQETETGRALLAQLKAKIANGIDKPGTSENDALQALMKGDAARADAITADFKSHPAPGSATNPLFASLSDKALYCLVMQDKAEGAKTAAVAAAFAKYLEPQIDEASKAPGADDYWRSVRAVCGAGPALGFIYDFSQPYMTKDQADTFRRVLTKATKGRYVLGMDLPHHWRNWNFIGMAEEFPLMSLALEGEEGFDPRIFARGSEVAHDYVDYSMSDQGIAKEAIGYHTAGFSHLSLLMLAMANRGDNLFINDKYRKMFENWFVWAMQPYGDLWESSGDLGTFPPDFSTLQTAKFFYPANPKIDFVFQNHPAIRKMTAMSGGLLAYGGVLAYLTPADPLKGSGGKVVDYHYGADFKMPQGLYDPQRGYLFARDGWSKDATSLQFVARSDTLFVSHDDADRGTFYFTAMGQPWSLPSFREVETKYTNTIIIDGLGQGYSATPATWVNTIDTPVATFGTADLSYCYDWRWVKSPMTMSAEEFARKPWLSSYVPVRARLGPRYANVPFERDPLPQVVDYYSGYLAGDPRMWDEDTWIMRAPANPVQRAFRTAGLVRGNRSYALIVDDFQKDDREHLYEWAMQMPMNVEIHSIKGGDLIVGPLSDKRVATAPGFDAYRDIGTPIAAPGAPLLLVRVLNANQPAIPTGQSNPRLETIEYLRHDDSHQFGGRSTGLGKRLVLPSRSVAPDYKVLLFPLKQGEPLPVTTWSDDKKSLTLEWNGQKDEYQFDQDQTGRTHLTLHRGADLIFQQN